MENPWKKVSSRRSKKSLYTLTPIPIKKYWNGFTKDGKERWCIEMNNGTVLTSESPEYENWCKRYTSNGIES